MRAIYVTAAVCVSCAPAPSSLPVANLAVTDEPIVVEVPLDQARTVPVRLVNTGTAEAQVQLVTEPPVSGPASFSVPAAGSRQVLLTVRPQTVADQTVAVLFRTQWQELTRSVDVRVDVDADDDGFTSLAAGGTDCDDSRASVSPEATERCNGLDDDCDGRVDTDAVDAIPWFLDNDSDTWGAITLGPVQCAAPFLHVARTGDCDDEDPDIHPGQTEVYYDGIDANCDSLSDYDADGDGFDSLGWSGLDCRDSDPTAYPGAPERLDDGTDQDCDGVVDERTPVLGDLVITEAHPDPVVGPAFVEIASTTGDALALDGITLVADVAHSLPSDTNLLGNQVSVVCATDGPTCDIVVLGLDLTAAAELRIGPSSLDSIPLEALPWERGASAEWPGSPDVDANDEPSLWCTTIGGSPGRRIEACEAAP